MFSLIDITPQPIPNVTEYPETAFRLSLEDGTITRKEELANCSLIINIQPRGRCHA